MGGADDDCTPPIDCSVSVARAVGCRMPSTQARWAAKAAPTPDEDWRLMSAAMASRAKDSPQIAHRLMRCVMISSTGAPRRCLCQSNAELSRLDGLAADRRLARLSELPAAIRRRTA